MKAKDGCRICRMYVAFAESEGVQVASGFAGTRNATRSVRLFARNRVCHYGWKPLAAC
jgi:hypothetical protein